MKRKDGSIFTTEHTVARLLNDKGELTGWVSVIRDITERKKTEEALHESEEKYRSVVENASELITVTSEKGMLVYANPMSEAVTGYSQEELVGKSLADIVHPDDFRDVVRDGFYWEVKRTDPKSVELHLGKGPENAPKLREFRIITKTGDVRWLEVNAALIQWNNRPAVLQFSTDVTEQKRLENEVKQYTEHLMELVTERTEKLKESEERYRSVVENIPYVVWVNCDKKTVYMSPNVSKVLGYTPNEIISNGDGFWWIKIHPDDETKVEAAIEGLVTGNTGYEIEYRAQRKDGEWIWLHEKATSHVERDGVRYVYGLFSDITDRKRLEEELSSAKEQLEYAVFSNPAVIIVNTPLSDRSDYTGTFISKSVSSVLGWEAEQLVGESGDTFWTDHIPVEDLQKYKDEIPSLWKDGQHTFEYRFLHKDGKYRWIREELKVIRDREGNVRDVVGYWVDISKEKTLEEALRTSEQNLRKANENLELGIVETTEQIENIAKLREKLRQTPDLSTGLEMVLETILWEFGMEIGAIFAFDRGKGLANLQAMKARTEDVSLQQTYSLNTGLIEFEATPAKNVAKLIAVGDNSVLKTKSVYSTPIIIGNDVYGVLAFGGDKTEKLTDIDLIILEFYTELISQTITERRLTVIPVREKSLQDATASTSWPTPIKTVELERGRIYITNNNASLAYETFSKFVLAGSEGLCVTREHPSKIRKRLGLEKTPIVWLTGEASPNEHTIGSLQDLSITLGDFLQKAEHPILLLDGFEYLITNNTFESFLKFLQIIRDRVQSHNAIVLAPLMEKAFESRTLGLIERETTILETKT
jgi:PAS domain S-box-containing protein